MKKVIALILALVMLIVLVGCSKTETPVDTTQTETSAAETAATTESTEEAAEPAAESKGYKIGFSNYSIGNSFRVQMEEEFKAHADALKEQGVVSEYIMVNADGDVSKQIADMRDLINSGVDAILISAASPSALSPVCEEAEQAGIKVIAFNEVVDTDNITCKLEQDENQYGTIGAEWLVEQLSGKGNVVCLNGVAGANVDIVRTTAYQNVFKSYPDIKVLSEVCTDWDYAKSKEAIQTLISAYGDQIDGVYCQGGAQAQAVIDAYTEAGMDLVPVTGEGNNGFLKVWEANLGKGFTSVAPASATYVSAQALNLAIDALNGKEIKAHVWCDMPIITNDNLMDYVRDDLPDSYWNATWLTETQLQAIYG